MWARDSRQRHSLSQSELQILCVPVWRFEGLQADCILMSGAWEIKHFTTPPKLTREISNGEWVKTERPEAEANSLELY